MTLQSLQTLFKSLVNDDMNMIYSGDISDQLTAKIIELNDYQFDNLGKPKLGQFKRKTGFLIAECFQNIVRHNDSNIEDGYFYIKNNDGIYSITSGNIVRNSMIAPLESQLNRLNELSATELREVYRNTLSNGEISEKGGAGLGLIEMARKSKNKLKFSFSPIDTEKSYFYFQLHLKTSKLDQVNTTPNLLEKAIELRTEMLENNTFLVYKGDVSMPTILPILSMVESSIESFKEDRKKQKTVFIILTEFLQNISTHGARNEMDSEGMVTISEIKSKYTIGGINYIYTEEVPILESFLKKYATAEQDFLNSEYKRILKDGDRSNKNGSSLGIIEIARRSSELNYEIKNIENGLSEFTFIIHI